ncbi:MAG: hypothetical protein F9K19_09875 [Rhizobiaceae bacterium]|nr:MAG: hypothetical protein F9K19_09875 [Rhizobiaceae bacterium]CAG0963112.1 hypothetical protein RHIZO_00812 [Rhizobiaceae bacterium]
MPHETQGSACRHGRPSPCRAARPLLLFAAPAVAVVLAGCAGGVDLRKAAVDETIVTGSVASSAAQPTDALLSDQFAIRDAVSSVDPGALGETGLAWGNERTGSRGTVTALVETTRKGMPCRRFVASRESFDGVKRYAGEICRAVGDLWQVRSFEEG